MPSLEELQQEVEAIKKRNQRVEADKAWETSWARRVLILFLTYIVIVVFLFFAELPKPFINAIIPAIAFVLSTLSVLLLKNWWLRKR
jgi:polyferredoxin